MTARYRKFVGVLAIAGLSLATVLVYLTGPYLWAVFIGQHVLTSTSPNGKHTAVLRKKFNLIDFNFTVKVNGKSVYLSPDLCGRHYEENFVWSRSGERLVLKLKGRRVLAYDAQNEILLGKGQIDEFERQVESVSKENDCASLKDIEEQGFKLSTDGRMDTAQ